MLKFPKNASRINSIHAPTLAVAALTASTLLFSAAAHTHLLSQDAVNAPIFMDDLSSITLDSPLWEHIADHSDQPLHYVAAYDDDHSWQPLLDYDGDNGSHDDDDTILIPYHHEITLVASELDADPSLIYAVTRAESQFQADAQSHAGAVGLMQVIADRAGVDAYHEVYNVKQAPNEYELKDPYINLKLGTAYLKLLEQKYFHQIEDKELRQALVLAAYNWGPGNVRKHLMNKNSPRNLKEAKWALWAKAPRETWSYVNKVMKYQLQYDATLNNDQDA